MKRFLRLGPAWILIPSAPIKFGRVILYLLTTSLNRVRAKIFFLALINCNYPTFNHEYVSESLGSPSSQTQ